MNVTKTTSSILNEIGNFDKKTNTVSKVIDAKPDTFEKQVSTEKKFLKNKNLIIAGGVIAAAAVAAFVFRKDIAGFAKKITKSVPSTPKVAPQTSATSMPVVNTSVVSTPAMNATHIPTDLNIEKPRYQLRNMDESFARIKTDMINDLKNGYEITAGTGFWGVDSMGKEAVFEDYIQMLSDQGFVIKRLPRVKDKPSLEFCIKVEEYMEEAKKLFEEKKQHTAIVIRDLDKIAPSRSIDTSQEVNQAVGTLMDFEYAPKYGFTLVAEAVDMLKVDSAIRRAGRMNSKLFCRPTLQDPKSVWDKYVDMIKTHITHEKYREFLLNEAEMLMKNIVE